MPVTPMFAVTMRFGGVGPYLDSFRHLYPQDLTYLVAGRRILAAAKEGNLPRNCGQCKTTAILKPAFATVFSG